MKPGFDQYRLAIAVFDDPETLRVTIAELTGKGFGLEQFCLVALANTMSRVRLGDSVVGHLPQNLCGLYEHTESWSGAAPGNGDGDIIVATKGSILNRLLLAEIAADDTKAPNRITEQHRSELVKKILDGAIVLIVSALDPAQQRLSSRMFLAKSTHNVKTYEFTIMAGSDQPRDG